MAESMHHFFNSHEGCADMILTSSNPAFGDYWLDLTVQVQKPLGNTLRQALEITTSGS
jgi:hypothetical protein